MAYKIIVSPRAQREIENAIDFYALYSYNAPAHFISILNEAYRTLEINPFFRVYYKNVHGLKLKRFPYSLFYIISENTKSVRVLSCFHNKLDPGKRPRYENT